MVFVKMFIGCSTPTELHILFKYYQLGMIFLVSSSSDHNMYNENQRKKKHGCKQIRSTKNVHK